jgi:hypothetical protein
VIVAFVTLDPNEVAFVPFPGEASKPAEAQAGVLVKYLSYREHRQVWKFIDEAQAANDAGDEAATETAVAKLKAAVAVGFRGYRNAGEFTAADDLDAILSYSALWDFAIGLTAAVSLSEKARFSSRLPSGLASTVAAAPRSPSRYATST